ncbi:hypothetical protein [Microbispora bryophytorum]|uniref:hypothetical protein n=1 Tax=Microbispora bryophytorum TaxID=1460882 RepID=UPI00340B5775
MTSVLPGRARLTGLSFLGAGILFVLYPVVRPYSDETSLSGASAMASPAWMAAHLFAVAGFVLLALGVLGLHLLLDPVLDRPLALRAAVVAWIGAGLTLPYYGAEVFGLNVIAARAVRDGDASLLALADEFRYGPVAAAMFLIGLVLLGAGALLAAIAAARSGTLPRWSAAPLAAGFLLFIPQFFATPAIRVAHGVLIALGAAWLAVALWRLGRRSSSPAV